MKEMECIQVIVDNVARRFCLAPICNANASRTRFCTSSDKAFHCENEIINYW
jgi:hypothetical protein